MSQHPHTPVLTPTPQPDNTAALTNAIAALGAEPKPAAAPEAPVVVATNVEVPTVIAKEIKKEETMLHNIETKLDKVLTAVQHNQNNHHQSVVCAAPAAAVVTTDVKNHSGLLGAGRT